MAKPHRLMAKKAIAPDLGVRIDEALTEGRSQHALELAKQLFRSEATQANRERLKRAYLLRGKQLRERGAMRDSVTVLKAALLAVDGDANWLKEIAEQLILSGGVAEGMGLLPRFATPEEQARLSRVAIDEAVRQGGAGRASIPPALHAQFDAILRAAAHTEKGEDEAARAALAQIGLNSPFTNWKLFLRGLLAYYSNDDTRAIENWQRLDPASLPSRLAAPFRLQIEPTWRDAQAPAVRNALQLQWEAMDGASIVTQLKSLRSELENQDSLANAFRRLEALLPAIRTQHPTLLPRFANLMYWQIQSTGPRDIKHYHRVFGAPANDPNFTRMQAFALERGHPPGAHEAWQNYEREISKKSTQWPDGQLNRARAMIWLRMGENAASCNFDHILQDAPSEFRNMRGLSHSLHPTAEECFTRAIELAPDLLAAHEARLQYLLARGDDGSRALEFGKSLLARFPDHVPTLTEIGHLHRENGDFAAAMKSYQAALRGNPLDRELREHVATVHFELSRVHCVARDLEAARRELQSSVAMSGGAKSVACLCREAAIEWLAKNPEQAELALAEAKQLACSNAAVALRMLAEASLLKLPANAKRRFENDYSAGLAEPISIPGTLALARVMADFDREDMYRGQASHEKKALTYLGKGTKLNWTEADLLALVEDLRPLSVTKPYKSYVDLGARKFRTNPFFPFFQAVMVLDGPQTWNKRKKAERLLNRAEALADECPQSEKIDKLLAELEIYTRSFSFTQTMMDRFDRLFGR